MAKPTNRVGTGDVNSEIPERGDTLDKVEKLKAQVAAKIDPNRHDPKTCRVYRCGACVASKGGK